MTDTPEFSRPFSVRDIAPEGRSETLSATFDECDAVAGRFGVEAIKSLSATLNIQPWKRGGFRVRGDASAKITQICVVTLEPFEQVIQASLDQVFVEKSSSLVADQADVVVSIDDEDIGYIEDDNIELGEFAVEALCLELDPYPRKQGAEFSSSTDGDAADNVKKENPFAVLKQLKLGQDE